MKRKRENEGNMMEEAIEKASQLINLLQKENSQLKRKIDNLEKDLVKAHAEIEELKLVNKQIEEDINISESNVEELKAKLELAEQSLSKYEQTLKRKSNANKQLHDKISNLNLKLKERNKSTNEEKTKMLSLENENEYLLKKLRDYEEKESTGVHKLTLKYSDYEHQLKEVIRIKEAFARRCQELKADNLVLTEKAAEYKQKLIEAEAYLSIKPRKMQEFPREPKIQPNSQAFSNDYYQNLVDKLVKEKLGITPEHTFQGKLDQIGSFLTYRLNHLQKMCQNIMQKLQIKQWCKLQNLKDLNSSSYRMHSYLTELLNKTL